MFRSSFGNILDVVLTDDPDNVLFFAVDPPIGSSDHNVVVTKILAPTSVTSLSSPSRRIWKYKNTDWTSLNGYLAAIDWSDILLSEDLDRCWYRFSETIRYAMQKFIPCVKDRCSTRHKLVQPGLLSFVPPQALSLANLVGVSIH